MKTTVFLDISALLAFLTLFSSCCEKKVAADIEYSSGKIILSIMNNSSDSLYFPVKDFSTIEIFYNGRKLKSIYDNNSSNIAINESDLEDILMKPKLLIKSWNYENQIVVDSLLFHYFLDRTNQLNYKINGNDNINKEMVTYLKSTLMLEGGFLFLKPHEIFSINFQVNSLNKLGKYDLIFKLKKRRYVPNHLIVKGYKSSQWIKIFLEPPDTLLGFRRYDSTISVSKNILLK
jgi:hypothetical protein